MEQQEWEEVAKGLTINIGSENPTSNYQHQEEKDIVLTVPVKVLRTIETYHTSLGRDYIDLFNDIIKVISIKNKNHRIEHRIKNAVSDIRSYLARETSRRKSSKFLDSGVKRITVHETELENTSTMKTMCQTLITDKNEVLSRSVQQAKENESLKKALSDTKRKLDESVSKNDELTVQNSRIQLQPVLPNSGKKIGDLKNCSKKKQKVETFKNRLHSATWFAESFGITIEGVKCRDENGKTMNLDYTTEKDDEERNESRLNYLLDQFAVGEDFYNELTQLCPTLPRSYRLIKRRHELNSTFKLYRTPDKPGAFVKIVDELHSLLEKNFTDKLIIRISADGAPMSRVTNYVTFSMAVLSDSEVDLSSKSLITLAIGEVRETYEDMDHVLKPFFDELNHLLNQGFIMYEEKKVEVKILLSGDMKILLLLTGLNAANAQYACVWCKIGKDDRYDMTKSLDYYNTPPISRSLEETEECLGNKSRTYGVKHAPLIRIDPNSIIACELHVLLRIFDVLIGNLVEDSRSFQFEKGIKNPLDQRDTAPVKILETKIKMCGVSFHFWERKDGNGRGTGKLEWTSLTGSARKLVLARLPSMLDATCVHDDSLVKTVETWTNFQNYYNYIQKVDPDSQTCFELARTFVSSFLLIGSSRIGYQKANVTPYFHVATYHIPYMVKMFKNVIQFSGQNVEKLNDDIRKTHLRKSSRWDGTLEALTVEKRLEYGRKEKLDRKKRSYEKRDDEYWNGGRLEETRNRKRKILAEINSGSSQMNDA